ncbi:hypothetical protein LguiB_014027 [Lonicera macranthoides]
MVSRDYPECGVYLNGFIYWLVCNSIICNSIICVDLENERFKDVPWHDDMKRKFRSNGLSVMGGHLVFCEIGVMGELDVWELKEDRDNEEKWIKLMTISFKICAQIRRGNMFKFILPVCFLENGKVLFHKEETIFEKFFEGEDVLLKATPGSLFQGTFVVYDPKRNSRLETFPIQGIADNFAIQGTADNFAIQGTADNCWKCVTYIESLGLTVFNCTAVKYLGQKQRVLGQIKRKEFGLEVWDDQGMPPGSISTYSDSYRSPITNQEGLLTAEFEPKPFKRSIRILTNSTNPRWHSSNL